MLLEWLNMPHGLCRDAQWWLSSCCCGREGGGAMGMGRSVLGLRGRRRGFDWVSLAMRGGLRQVCSPLHTKEWAGIVVGVDTLHRALGGMDLVLF